MDLDNMLSDMAIQLRAYTPDGDPLGILPEPLSISMSSPFSKVSSLIFNYRKDAPGAAWFTRAGGLEVALELWIPGARKWVEPPNCRFLVLDWEDDVADVGAVMKFTCPGYAWLLDKQKVRKGKNDDRLNKLESDAKKAMDEAKSEWNSAQSKVNSVVTRVRNAANMTGYEFFGSRFPRTTTGGKGIRHRSILWHTTRKKWYHFNYHTQKWYYLRKDEVYRTHAEMHKAYTDSVAKKRTYEARKAAHDRAKYNAREAAKNGKRPMLNTTAGWALLRHINESRGYGGNRLSGFKFTFNGTTGTGGKKWSERFNIDLTVGMSLLDLLEQLTEMGVCEWVMQGRTLHVYRPGDYSVDLSSRVSLRPGTDVSEAPDKSSRRGHANYLLVRGEENLSFGMWNGSASRTNPWGTWEESISVSGAKTVGDAKTLALKEAREKLKRIRVQSTRQIIVRPNGYRPLYDYLPGHYIRIYGTDGHLHRVRVEQVTLTSDNTGTLSGNLVLGDRFYQSVLNFRRQLSRTVGGYEKPIGGGTVPLLPGAADTPSESQAAVIPSVSASVRMGVNEASGKPSTVMTVSWSPGTELAEEYFAPEQEPGLEEADPDEVP